MRGMKTKFIIPITSLCSLLLFLETVQGQVSQNNNPDTKFNVHRQYDEKGNLIEYDSTSVSTWNSDSTQKNIVPTIGNWKIDPFHQLSDSNSIENQMKNLFGFEFNDNNIFPFSFPNIEDFFSGRNKDNLPEDSNSMVFPLQPDTLLPSNPLFIAPFDKNFETRMREIQQEIQSYMQEIEQQHKSDTLNEQIQKPLIPNSKKESTPKVPEDNSNNDKTINI
jgi:hypothetical protein